MKTVKTKILLPGFIFALGCFYGLQTNAQLVVDANGSVGVGYTTGIPTFTGKLDVQVTATNVNLYSAYLRNLNATNNTKFGVYNTVSNAGTGGRYGIFNDVQQNSASTSSAYGIYSNTSAYNGFAVGHYNILSGNGTATLYGMINYSFKNLANTSSNIGLYNYTSHTNNTGSGIYNYTYLNAATSGVGYGHQNYLNSYSNTTGYGIYNQVIVPTSTVNGVRYGIYNQVDNIGGGVKYGIYSSAPGTANYAGYFNGNVHVQGVFTVGSDDNIKTDVVDIPNALARVNELRGVNFRYRQDLGYDFPEGLQYGFLASNIERVAPEIVFKNVPAVVNRPEPGSGLTQEGRDPELVKNNEFQNKDYRSVSYMSIIPLLVQAIKELNGTARTQAARIQELENTIQEMKRASTVRNQ